MNEDIRDAANGEVKALLRVVIEVTDRRLWVGVLRIVPAKDRPVPLHQFGWPIPEDKSVEQCVEAGLRAAIRWCENGLLPLT